MRAEFVAREQLSDAQDQGLDQLRAAVYPPDVVATLPGRFFTWAPPQWSVLLWDGDELVSRVGLTVREVMSEGVIKRVGGIGGVMTHPARQGRGLASQAMGEAARRLDADLHVAYGLLFCRPHLVPFYQRLGWQPFRGQVYVEQPQGRVEFSLNGAMVRDVREPAPLEGTLDLQGLPW